MYLELENKLNDQCMYAQSRHFLVWELDPVIAGPHLSRVVKEHGTRLILPGCFVIFPSVVACSHFTEATGASYPRADQRLLRRALRQDVLPLAGGLHEQRAHHCHGVGPGERHRLLAGALRADEHQQGAGNAPRQVGC